ncbi:MAG: hypothetical protein CMM01_01275 [Rhodopirellula sp.]|nr:hypothetical protein [Rhodopirellula sp.]
MRFSTRPSCDRLGIQAEKITDAREVPEIPELAGNFVSTARQQESEGIATATERTQADPNRR